MQILQAVFLVQTFKEKSHRADGNGKIHFERLWRAKTVSSKALSNWKAEDNTSLQAALPSSLLGYTLETHTKIPSLWETL